MSAASCLAERNGTSSIGASSACTLPRAGEYTRPAMAHDGALPLARFTVLDLTRARAGPTRVRPLVDRGADLAPRGVICWPSATVTDCPSPRLAHAPPPAAWQAWHRASDPS